MDFVTSAKIALAAAAILMGGSSLASAHGTTALTYLPYTGMGDPNGLASHQADVALATDPHYVAYSGLRSDVSTDAQPRIALASAAVNPLAEAVRSANARFADFNVALKEGYAPIPCASGVEGGAMGVHFVNGAYLKDDAVEIGKPEAVMYEPQADGSMQLVAVEYITFKGPANLGGQLFAFNGAPNRYGLDPFYELHVWAWRDNPKGTFADMNPNVSCAAAREPAAM